MVNDARGLLQSVCDGDFYFTASLFDGAHKQTVEDYRRGEVLFVSRLSLLNGYVESVNNVLFTCCCSCCLVQDAGSTSIQAADSTALNGSITPTDKRYAPSEPSTPRRIRSRVKSIKRNPNLGEMLRRFAPAD